MGFLDSLDIANRACQILGQPRILSVDEESGANTALSFAYDKLRRTELRRNNWRFAMRRAVVRPIDTTTRLLNPQVWADDTLYLPGSIVRDDNGELWLSNQADNIGNEPGVSFVWEKYYGPVSVLLYDTTQTYFAGELVYKIVGSGGFVVFLSLLSSNDSVPSTATAYDATVTYNRDAVVSYSGSQWRSLIAVNKAVTPADAPATFDISATYAIASTTVASDGYIYTSLGGSNVGHDPVFDGGIHWSNTGVPAAWSRVPTIYASASSWLPIYAGLTNLTFIYPIGSGPVTQSATRNVYRLPAGFLRLAPQDPKAGSVSPLGAPSGLPYSDWLQEGDYIVTRDTNPIILRFTADIMDVRQMDDMFCEGLAARMAEETCELITQSTSKIQVAQAAYKMKMTEARVVNAIETGPEEPPEDDFVTCRA